MYFLLSLCLIPLFYLYLKNKLNYWYKRGIKGPKPRMFMGTFPNLFNDEINFNDDLRNIYNEYKKSENVVGTFMARTPILMVIDPEQIKDVLVSSFNSFNANILHLFELDSYPLLRHNPFLTSGENWKKSRATVTPGFTTMRLKAAFPDMLKVSQKLIDYIEEKSSNGKQMDGKDLALRFTAENISESILGIQTRAFSDNAIPVTDHANLMFSENKRLALFGLFMNFVPELSGKFNINLMDKKYQTFFTDFIAKIVTIRRQKKLERQDYIHYILSLAEQKGFDDPTVYEYIMVLLIDGIETSGIALASVLRALSDNPLKAQKLREELQAYLNENANLGYEELIELPYLDACIHEALRIYPPANVFFRIAIADHEFRNKDGSKTKIYKGEQIFLPNYAVHMDEDIYPNPFEFQPERFMPENGGVKKYRDMGVYFAFGHGPRICVGMRLALLQIKVAVSAIIRHFYLKSETEGKIPKLDLQSFFGMPKGGVPLKFVKVA